MRNSRRALKAIIFLALVAVLNGLLDYLLYPYTYSRAEMYHMEKTDLNQIIVGTSHGKCGIKPVIILNMSVMGKQEYRIHEPIKRHLTIFRSLF